MGSTHFIAVAPQLRLREKASLEFDEARELTPAERRAIRKLSAQLEERTFAWIDEVNRTGKWRTYYSHTAHTWLVDGARANREVIPPATSLYVWPGPEGLYCTGMENEGFDDWSFFGFMNYDDVQTDLDVTPFLREYVRRLSTLVPDLLWCYDYEGDAYWYGVPISIKRRGTVYPRRTAPRRDRIPRHVIEALGEAPPLPPERCRLCGRANHQVTPQLLADAVAPAHEECYKIFWRGVMGGMPPARRGNPPDMEG